MEAILKKTSDDKKIIVILWPYGFRSFDWDRLELYYLEKKSDIVVYELLDIFSPWFAKAYAERSNKSNVLRFNSLYSWAKNFYILTKNSKGPVVLMNFVNYDSFKGLLINFIISKLNCTIIDYKQPGVPNVYKNKQNLIKSFRSKFKLIVNIEAWKTKYKHGQRMFYSALGGIFSLYPDYRFVAGDVAIKAQHTFCKSKNIKLISACTWDYSRIVRLNPKRIIKTNYAVLLDGAGPMFSNDALLTGQKTYITSDKWYPSLTQYLDIIEDVFNLKVVISAHPKTKHERFPDYFGGREVFHGETYNLVHGSDLIITRMSTAVSYAIAFKKPVNLIYSDQIIKSGQGMAYINTLANLLDINPININTINNHKNLSKIASVNFDLYESYIAKYLSSQDVQTPNYKILQECAGL